MEPTGCKWNVPYFWSSITGKVVVSMQKKQTSSEIPIKQRILTVFTKKNKKKNALICWHVSSTSSFDKSEFC